MKTRVPKQIGIVKALLNTGGSVGFKQTYFFLLVRGKKEKKKKTTHQGLS